MTTPDQRALAACVRYVAACAEIKRLTTAIGEALSECPLNRYDEIDRTCLRRYYHPDGCDNVTRSLCPACKQADCLIQERKAARRRLGAVKSLITAAGKAGARA